MRFDILSAVEVTASAAIVAAVLSFSLSTNVRGRLAAASIVAAWFLIVVVLGAAEGLAPQHSGAPGLAAAVALPIAALCYAFFAVPSTRAAMLATPLALLIAVNALRVIPGVLFVLLYSAHRLPAPFAPSAGWGDIFVGLTAGPLSWIAWRYGARANGLVFAWNIVGFLDLAAAIAFGATSAPGPIQLFAGPPTSEIMTSLPWLLVPCFMVPIYQSLHLAIFYRLSREVGAIRPSNRRAAPQQVVAGSP